MKYKINKSDLLYVLCKIENKRDYNCKTISKYINKLLYIKEPKLNKILLNDNSCLTDLVFLEKFATEKEITLVINGVIAEKPNEYTNEDIYFAIDKAFGIKEMIDLSSIKEFCY